MLKDKTDEFIDKAKLIHGEKYNYDEVIYLNNRTNIIIKCNKCGNVFKQNPYNHLHIENCCPVCKNKFTTDFFITRAKQIHGDKYSYDKVKYINSEVKVTITCPIHGDFEQKPNGHLSGKGCEKCSYEQRGLSKSYTNHGFIEKSKEVHGDTYDYSKTTFNGTKNKITITCKIHGDFTQLACHHLKGCGCKKCSTQKNGIKKRKDNQTFIDECIKKHGDLYDYSVTEYVKDNEKVKIKCKACDKFFEQSPRHHLNGEGCPICKQSRLEKYLMIFFDKNKITYKREVNNTIFKWIGLQSFDFYLPDYNIVIECQGGQHFKEVKRFGGYKSFLLNLKRDIKKNNLCKKNNIKILYLTEKKSIKEIDIYDEKFGGIYNTNNLTFSNKELLEKILR